MIILDTNVLSELMTPNPNNSVMSWFAVQSEQALFTTSITQAEMCLGVAILPVGQRQSNLLVAIDDMFNQDFAGRILAFDSSVVSAYVQIVTHRKQIGRPISQFDAQIAAIAKTYDAILATRNIKDFESCGIELVNPWL
jgi:hypothetical protein